MRGADVARGVEDGQLAARLLAVVQIGRAQRAGRGQLGGQQVDALGLGQRQVVGAAPGLRQQLGHGLHVHVGVLAQVDGREVKAEHLHRALEPRQPAGGQRRAAVAAQRIRQHGQLGAQFIGRGIGLGSGHAG